MGNTLVNTTLVVYEVAKEFANSLRGVSHFNREYNDEFARKGGKVGDTVKIRLPQQYTAEEGEALVVQNLFDQTANLIINRRRHIGFGWSSAQETLDLDNIRVRYINPAAETLANIYDRLALADVYKAIYSAQGTLGTTPNSPLTYMNATVNIADLAGPDNGLIAVLDPKSDITLANTTAALFHPARSVSANWTKGQFAHDQLGIDKWFRDQNIPAFTSGAVTVASTPLVNGASQTGSSLVTDGWGSGGAALKKGDIITIAGVRKIGRAHV